eukprot:PhM_4_TR16122/c4_g1_i1/m.101371
MATNSGIHLTPVTVDIDGRANNVNNNTPSPRPDGGNAVPASAPNRRRKLKLIYGSLSSIIYCTAIMAFVFQHIWLTTAGWASTTAQAMLYTAVVYTSTRPAHVTAPLRSTPTLLVSCLNLFATFTAAVSLYVYAALSGDGLQMDSKFLAAIAWTASFKWAVTLHLELVKMRAASGDASESVSLLSTSPNCRNNNNNNNKHNQLKKTEDCAETERRPTFGSICNNEEVVSPPP